jgi:hypothetical protein
MAEESLLLTIAEVSIGFAGFAGIVALFGRRAAGPWSTADRMRFDGLIRYALLSLFAAFLPLAIHYVSPDHGSPWRAASTVLGLVFLLHVVGVIFEAGAGPYLVALFVTLTVTGVMFARLLRFA